MVTNVPLGRPQAMAALIGRRAQLSDAVVLDVVGDTTFWVGSSLAESVLVYLEEERDDDLQVEPGQVVRLTGLVKPSPSAAEIEEAWELDPDTAEAVVGDRVYVYVASARDFTILSKP